MELPVEFLPSPSPAIRWRDINRESLAQPNLSLAVEFDRKHFASSKEYLAITDGSLSSVHDYPQPAAFIFHISRCGSTLFTNLCRESGSISTIAESQAINAGLMLSALFGDSYHHVLRQIIGGTVGALESEFGVPCLIKLSSWNVMHFRAIAKLWPDVPRIFIVRNPLEVVASHIARPAPWSTFASKEQSRALGLHDAFTSARDQTEFSAFAISAMLNATCHNSQPGEVIDYRQITAELVANVLSDRLDRIVARGGLDSMLKIFANDSKRPTHLFQKINRPVDTSISAAVKSECDAVYLSCLKNCGY